MPAVGAASRPPHPGPRRPLHGRRPQTHAVNKLGCPLSGCPCNRYMRAAGSTEEPTKGMQQ